MSIQKTCMLFVAVSLFVTGGGCGVAEEEAPLSAQQARPAASPETELPTQRCTTFYYDAPGGNVVGYCTIACSGGARCTGIKTSYHDQQCESCR